MFSIMLCFLQRILPRLIPHAAVLASDRRLSLALIQRILHLDEKMSPSNHHVSVCFPISPEFAVDLTPASVFYIGLATAAYSPVAFK